MKTVSKIAGVCCIAGSMLGGCASKKSSPPPDMEAMMQKYMEMNATDHHHAKMAKSAGYWTANSTMWMHPGAEPQTSVAQSRIESVMDGRYLIEHMDGNMEMGGQSFNFRGMNIVGYDTFKQKWVNCWFDNYSTGLMVGYGTESADGKTVTYRAEVPDPMTGKLKKMKYEAIDMGENKMIFRMFDTTPDGQEYKHMETVYTRN